MTHEVPAHLIVEHQTRQIARIYKSSRPKPRNKAMGFRGEKPKNGFHPASDKAYWHSKGIFWTELDPNGITIFS